MNSAAPNTVVSSEDYIPLERRFNVVSKGIHLNDDVDPAIFEAASRDLSWTDLTQEYRIVILAEAGAGKTEEIRQAARLLRAQGKPAFFLRLELVASHFDTAFEVGARSEFDTWMQGEAEGWLLLDSVDEARLGSPNDFNVAIRKVASILAGALDRTHIVLTSRATAWRPLTDLALCETQLPFRSRLAVTETEASADDSDDSDTLEPARLTVLSQASLEGFRIVALQNLNTNQIDTFLRGRGVGNADEFIRAVERADASTFTSRPQDLEELIVFWTENGRIGNRLEMMRNSIDRRLTERDETRAQARPLSPAKARQGARLLAAATTLCRNQSISVRDGLERSDGIVVSEILQDWTEVEQATLLARPIFDGALYGRSRFHHRTVREYLAAEWLNDLLKQAPSRRPLENLIFRKQFGCTIVAPTMRPLVPWLALMDDKIQQKMLEIAPEIAFEGGDPQQLSLVNRRRILVELCEQMASGRAGRSVSDAASVQRFASPDLASDIRGLLEKYAEDDNVSSYLLRMVWLGELFDLRPEALAIACSPRASTVKRVTAIRALEVIAHAGDIDAVRAAFLDEGIVLDRRIAVELINDLSAEEATTAWLVACLAKVAPARKHYPDGLARTVLAFVDAAQVQHLETFVDAAATILIQSAREEPRRNIPKEMLWFFIPACRSVERLIEARHPHALSNACLYILRQSSLVHAYRDDDLNQDRSKISALVPVWLDLNRALFWYDVEQTRATLAAKSQRLTEWWQPHIYDAFWKFDASDFDFAADAMSSRPELDDRLVALSLAFELYRRNGRPAAWRKKMKSLALQQELSDRLALYMRPPAQPQASKMRAQDRRWKLREKADLEKAAKALESSKTRLQADLESLRLQVSSSPAITGRLSAISYLAQFIQEKDSPGTHWVEHRWDLLTRTFGANVAHFYRDALVRFWRHYTPKVHSEGAPFNTTEYGTILGLAGLQIESASGHFDPATLSTSEALLACRYAIFELNGYPSWFEGLFVTHTKTVSAFLLNEIEFELTDRPAPNNATPVLQTLASRGEPMWDALSRPILDMIDRLGLVDIDKLERLLQIVDGSNLTDGELSPVAAKWCAQITAIGHLGRWLAFWASVDPQPALAALRSHLATRSDADAKHLAMIFAVSLCGRDNRRYTRSANLHPNELKDLYFLLHQHIRRADDINRANTGVYSPGLRDEAQEARDTLVERLNNIPGKSAYLALSGIAANEPSRLWFRNVAIEKASREGDIEAFSPKAIHMLAQRHERPPISSRQLADTLLLRLTELGERADRTLKAASGKAGVTTTPAAAAIVARELRLSAAGDYDVDEAQNATGAITAIKAAISSLSVSHRVHVRLVDGIRGKEVLSSFRHWISKENACSGRRGLFVVVQSKTRRRWRINGFSKTDLDGLGEALRNTWTETENTAPDVDDVDIVTVDLSAPSPEELNRTRNNLDRLLDFARWMWGTSLMRLGSTMVVAGISALTGIIQLFVEEIASKALDIELHIPETSAYVGWILLALGISVGLLAAFLQLDKKR